MSNPTFTGKVHLVDETKTYGQKGFRKRLVVLERDDGRFTNYVPFEFVQEGCSLADDLQVGDDIEMTYTLSGRKWQKDPGSEIRYFLNAEAISFRKLGSSNAEEAAGEASSANDALTEAADEDAPF